MIILHMPPFVTPTLLSKNVLQCQTDHHSNPLTITLKIDAHKGYMSFSSNVRGVMNALDDLDWSASSNIKEVLCTRNLRLTLQLRVGNVISDMMILDRIIFIG